MDNGLSILFRCGDIESTKSPDTKKCRILTKSQNARLSAPDGTASMHACTNSLCNRKPGPKSRNMQSKPEPEVVLAAILDPEGVKSLNNDCKLHRKAKVTILISSMLTVFAFAVESVNRK